MPGSPSPVGRKPGICQTGQLVTREGPEGSNPSPGAHLWETSAYLKLMAVREEKPDKYNRPQGERRDEESKEERVERELKFDENSRPKGQKKALED